MASSSFTGKEYSVFRGVDGKVAATPAKIPELGPKDVLIRITHSGVCYTDLEFFRHGAPLALGHEGVGIVEAVGSDVTSLKPGDRAGGGFHRDSCGHCEYCLTGRDIWCLERTIYGESDFDSGAFSPYYIGKETYVHRIPDGLDSADAAPLQCAGATVYSAIIDTVKRSTDRVGVVGIGGLGHLAIQFAAKMGHEVVVFSSSKSKEAEARAFGASEFVLLSEPEKVSAPVNTLIVAGSQYPDWNKFLQKNVLARQGAIVPLSAPLYGPLALPSETVFWQGYDVHFSLVASRAAHDDMLAFAAKHGVKPTIQVHKFEGSETISTIFKDLDAGKVRYRAVLAY